MTLTGRFSLTGAPCLFLGLCSTQKVPTGLASRPLRMKQRRAPLQRMIPLLRRIAVSRTISVRWQPSPETHNQDHEDFVSGGQSLLMERVHKPEQARNLGWMFNRAGIRRLHDKNQV